MNFLAVNSPYQIFTDTNGDPLEAGYIYIGEANKNPITDPIEVYWDRNFLYPAAQPIRTISGYPRRNGTPAAIIFNFAVNESYSIVIKNKNQEIVFSESSVSLLFNSPFYGAVNIKWFGAKGDGADDTDAIQNAINYAVGSPFHRPIYVPAGRYNVYDTIKVDSSTDPTDSNSHRNLIIFGDGGIGTEAASNIRFEADDPNKNGLEISSAFGVRIADVELSTTKQIKNVVIFNADPTPGFSGTLAKVENCYIQSYLQTPAEAVMQVLHWKNIKITSCWLGVASSQGADQTSLLAGGNLADSGSFLQQGEMDLLQLENNFIFGVVSVKKLRNFQILNNTFAEGFSASVNVIGDKDLFAGRISNNYFAGTIGDPNLRTGVTLGDFQAVGGEDAGCITVSHNRFRYRPVGVYVQGKGPYCIEYNHFRPQNSADIGIEIDAAAEAVNIGPNDFKDMWANSALGILDHRNTFATSQPTDGIDADIVADWKLSADDNSISATNNAALIGSVSNLFMRGGIYRVKMCVTVRNTSATIDMPFQAWIRYRDEDNILHEIGVRANGLAPNTSKSYTADTAVDTVYVDRLVHIKGTTDNTPTQSGFELYVRNTGSGTPPTGWVEGAASELAGSAVSWFQVEEYRV